MKRSSFLLAGIGLAACWTHAAFAQSDAPPPGAGGHPHQMRAPAPKTRADVESRVREQFAALDKNKDGFLTQDELRPPMPSEADRKAIRDRMFAMMDKDGNGEISKAEFDAFHAERHRWAKQGRGDKPMLEDHAQNGGAPHPGMPPMHDRESMMARMMFRHADLNHDGKVSLAEAEKAALERFDRIDTNHDGVISDAERDAAHQQRAARFRDRRTHWMEHKGDASPPPPPQA